MIAKSFVAALLPLTALAGYLPFPVKRGQSGPNCNIGPYQPTRPISLGFPKTRTCVVKANGDGSDDSHNILNALHECNNGGRVVFSHDKKYLIGTALDMTFLSNIDIDIQGYVTFSNDTNYWQAHAFPQVFQNATTYFQLGGYNVNVYGGGTLDGNGQVWYDLYAKNALILRPILFGVVGLHGGSITDLHLIQSPQYHFWVANTSDVIFYNLDLDSASSSNNTAKNTDGWDLYRSDNIVIDSCNINNGDDCVSFKPNSTNMLVQNLACNGSHGISVGSLGQYKTEVDIVENIVVAGINMSNAENGGRIKVWPGVPSEESVDLQGGGGTGRVSNISFLDFQINNCDYGIEITQCYGQSNLTLCNQYPSSLTISDVVFKNIKGTTSKKFSPVSGYLVCSSPSVCSNIEVADIDLVSPAGYKDLITCTNIPENEFSGINCTSLNKGQS